MSQFPPESPFDPPLQPFDPVDGAAKAGNGMAVTSLVFGLLGFCIPVLGGLLAILFGFLGLNKTKDPRVGGKGLAIAGLILGLLTTLSWGAGIAVFIPLIKNAVKAVTTGPGEFLGAIGRGDVNAAIATVDPASVDRAKVEAAVEEAKPWGPFKTFTSSNMTQTNNNGVSTMSINGQAVFQNQTKTADFKLSNSAAAPFTWKITSWTFQ